MTLSLSSPNITPPEATKRPRRSWPPAEQAAHLADFAASGLSATAFCRRLGIRRATLARWRQRAATTTPGPTPRPVAGRRVEPPRAAAGFAAVTVVADVADVPPPGAPPPGPLTLVLRAPSGVAADVAGLDVATATALLRAVLAPATAPSAGVGAG